MDLKAIDTLNNSFLEKIDGPLADEMLLRNYGETPWHRNWKKASLHYSVKLLSLIML